MPGTEIKRVLQTALNLVMPITKQQVFDDMERAGIMLDDESAYYSLSQIRDYLHLAFGSNAAEALADVLRNTLMRIHHFER